MSRQPEHIAEHPTWSVRPLAACACGWSKHCAGRTSLDPAYHQHLLDEGATKLAARFYRDEIAPYLDNADDATPAHTMEVA